MMSDERKQHTALYPLEKPSLIEVQKRRKKLREQPRWHSQPYMLYLALRQHPQHDMPRTDLIKTAIAIDQQLSQEHSIPKVFRGKTPMNSASAILTNNTDGYFVPYRPEGSRSMHFKLSFKPSNFKTCFRAYQEWQENLAKHDWPYYFDNKKFAENLVETLNIVYPTEFDEFMANRKRKRQEHFQLRCVTTVAPYDPNLPQSWRDIVQLKHNGLFSKRFLPRNTPLGLYFGVPKTEDEFEALKEHKGEASHYAYMYRKTVIDPTDDNGQLPQHFICPFHFIRETNVHEKANVIFYEGTATNQIICWTKRDIEPDQELFLYNPQLHHFMSDTNYWQKSPSIIPKNTTISSVN